MKSFTLLTGIMLLNCSMIYSQVAIKSDGTGPHSQAMLEVSSTTRGLLLPCMTIAEFEAILNPAKGLLVYCVDDDNFFVNRGTPTNPDWTMVNSKWRPNGLDIYYPGNNVGIGWQFPIVKLDIRGNNPDDDDAMQLCNSDISHKLLLSGEKQRDPNPFIQWKLTDALRFGTDKAEGDGQSALTAERRRDVANNGTGYGLNFHNVAIKGYSYWGDQYSFSVSGLNDNDFTRCGGVLGAVTYESYWGSLAYMTSGSTSYGGYFTSSTTGTGKGWQKESH